MRTTVGPLPPEVYWRRRLTALGLLVVALVGLRAYAGGDTSGASRAPRPKPLASARPDGSPDHPYVPGTTPSSAASLLPTPSSSASPTPSPSTRPAAIETCPDSSLQLTAAADARSYKLGIKPKLTMTVRVVGPVACRRDLGATSRELIIRSGTAHTWSSADCQPRGAAAQIALLRPGTAQTYALTWSGLRSQRACAGPPVPATAGTYRLQARLGTLRSSVVVFTLT